MSILFLQFQQAYQRGSGPLLATTITPISPPEDANRLRNIYKSYDSRYTTSFIEESIITPNRDLFSETEGELWVELYLAYWKAIVEILDAEDSKKKGSWVKAYEAWKEVANALIRGYGGGFQAWTVPCMYVVGRYLRIFAIKADQSTKGTGNNVKLSVGGLHDDLEGAFGKNETLEDAARQINRLFTLCLSDRAPLEESRKWGLYYITNLLFKTYFKLNSIGLSKNILRALGANTEMPPIESFPKSHIVTYKYYVGVIFFLNEAYLEAEENLTNALEMCHKDAHKNKELILTYLIPCHLLTTHTLPSSTLLLPYPRLNDLFKPLSMCIRRGDLAGFDAALAAGEDEFVKRRIYLTLERGRDIALRNLLRKVSIAGGFTEGQGEEKVRRTRIPLQEFIAAIRVGSSGDGRQIDGDEVECLLANMIYKNLMKGYISREKSMVVLSKTGAFPGTNI